MNPVLRASTASLLAVLFSSTSFTIGCSSSKTAEAGKQTDAQTQGSQPAAGQPTAQMSVDDLVAPIALYPDQLLGQILTSSMNAQEVLDLGNWLLQNQSLQGDALVNAAKQAGFSPSAQYLVAFPQVVDNMCQQMDWTRQLGAAFQADQKSVMDAIQRKRGQAQQMGNLASSPQMTVATQTDNGKQYVEIKPADPKVVYVPQYNPVTIYNTQAPAAPAPAAAPAAQTTATTESKSGVSTGTAVVIGLLSFGVGMAVGSAISNNNNYYPYPAWGYGGVYYGGRPYYPPPYRPVYPGYRPAYGYNPPPNYRWNQYNHNVNVNVNNNYYGRFNNNNVNTRPGGATTLPANNNRPGNNVGNNNRPGGNNPNWKGQTTYQGARPNTNNQRPGGSMAAVNPANQPGNRPGNGNANRPNAGNNPGAGNRPNGGTGAGGGNRPNMGANPGGATNRPNGGGANAGTRDMNRPNAGNAPATRPATQPNLNKGGDRGYSAPAARPATGATPSTRPAPGGAGGSRPSPGQNPQAQNRGGGGGGALGGAGSSARSDKAASNRGRSSMGASGGGAVRKR